jgi:hypothetical protein
LIALKYGIVVFLYFSGKSLKENYCSVANLTLHIEYVSEYLNCKGWWRDPRVLMITAACVLVLFIAYDLKTFYISKR